MIKKGVVKKLNQERVLLAVGLILFLLLLGITIYGFSFLGKNILRALSPEEVDRGELKFNLEEFDKLGL